MQGYKDKRTLNVTGVHKHYLYASADAEGDYVGSTPSRSPPSPAKKKTSNKTNQKKDV